MPRRDWLPYLLVLYLTLPHLLVPYPTVPYLTVAYLLVLRIRHQVVPAAHERVPALPALRRQPR